MYHRPLYLNAACGSNDGIISANKEQHERKVIDLVSQNSH